MTLEEYFSAKACVEKQEDKPKKKSKTEEIKQHAAIDPVNSIPNEHGVKEEVIVADINGNNFSTKGLNMKNYNEIDVLIKKRMETFSNKLKNTQGTRKTADINRKYKEKVKEGYENNRIDRMIKEWKTLNSKQAKNFSIYDGVDHVRSIYSSLINGGGALNFDAKSLAKKIGKGALIAGGVTAGLGAAGAVGLGAVGINQTVNLTKLDSLMSKAKRYYEDNNIPRNSHQGVQIERAYEDLKDDVSYLARDGISKQDLEETKELVDSFIQEVEHQQDIWGQLH